MRRTRPWLLVFAPAAYFSGLLFSSVLSVPSEAQVTQLSAANVQSVLAAAASAVADPTLAVAVVDRAGTILGVYRRSQAAANAPDVAVSLARTTAFFSNDQAPLASRTVRFISGIHFPPGIDNTPSAALYGVENINRGCALDPAGDAVFNQGQFVPRPRSIAGTFSTSAGVLPVPCSYASPQGCSLGITTGKADLYDTGETFRTPVNPGGIPLYRDGRLIGGVGVTGVSADRAEYAAVIAAAGTRAQTGITTAITFPGPKLPAPGAIYIDGIRLPFVGDCIDFECVQRFVDRRPLGSSSGSFNASDVLIPSATIPGLAAQAAPEGYLIGPRGSAVPGGLSEPEVRQMVDRAVARANVTRAQVRLPFGQTAKFVIAITDQTGRILAEYRMQDALADAIDVVPSKARNAYYFSTLEGYEVLRGYVDRSRGGYQWTPDPPPGRGWALTSRTLGFAGQPLFPSGIDNPDRDPRIGGPWFDLFVYDTENVCTEGPLRTSGTLQNGITWFPGSAPLYRSGELIGGVGVSGDGVEQNDYVTAAAAEGFEPPEELRVDRSFISTGRGEPVRLPYLKFPRNPEER